MKTNVVAKNKNTGTSYIFAEVMGVSGKVVSVSTPNAWPQKWLVAIHDVEFLTETSN